MPPGSLVVGSLMVPPPPPSMVGPVPPVPPLMMMGFVVPIPLISQPPTTASSDLSSSSVDAGFLSEALSFMAGSSSAGEMHALEIGEIIDTGAIGSRDYRRAVEV